MEIHNTKKISRFEALLGVAVIGIAVLSLPWLEGAMEGAKGADSRTEAGRIAQAVLDYHTEMGAWPAGSGEDINLAKLTAAPNAEAALGAMLPGGPQPWLDAIPVDAWGRPYRTSIFDERDPAKIAAEQRPRDDMAPPKPAPFPDTPPAGVIIVVLSAGPDGAFDTDLHTLAHAAVPAPRGDDIGFVLRGTAGDPIIR